MAAARAFAALGRCNSASNFGLTPIREALMRLAADGLVQRRSAARLSRLRRIGIGMERSDVDAAASSNRLA